MIFTNQELPALSSGSIGGHLLQSSHLPSSGHLLQSSDSSRHQAQPSFMEKSSSVLFRKLRYISTYVILVMCLCVVAVSQL